MLKILKAGCAAGVLMLALPVSAQPVDDVLAEKADAVSDKFEGEKFPVSGSLTLGYSFSQSNITDAFTERDESAAEQYGLEPASTPEGSQFLALNLGLSYSATDSVTLVGGLGVVKTIADGFLGGSAGSSLVNHETNLTDANLGARWSFFTIPVADIKLSATGDVRLPTSKGSITRGLIAGTRFSIGAGRKLGPVNLSLRGGFNYNFWEDPTQQIELRFADLVRISGADLGRPLPLSGWSGSLTVAYSPIDPLSLSVSYQISNSISAYEGPDDEFTAPTGVAQTGTQLGTGGHGFTASVGYTLPFDTRTSIGFSMSTALGLYSSDNKRITNPFFDTESPQGVYTGYSLSLIQAL